MSSDGFIAALREFSTSHMQLSRQIVEELLSETNVKALLSALDSNGDGYVSVIGKRFFVPCALLC